MVVVVSDDYLESDECDFQTKFALSLSPGKVTQISHLQLHIIIFITVTSKASADASGHCTCVLLSDFSQAHYLTTQSMW